MFAFIIYELKVAVILAAFYLCFKCFLSQEKLHRVNRIVLISTAILSFVLPLCVITFHKTVTVPALVGAGLAASSEIQADGSTLPATASHFSLELLAIIIYLAGVFAVLTSIIAGVVRVKRLIRNSMKKQMEGCDVMVCDKSVPPFSWMDWIVMSREDYDSGNRHILEHEKAHIRLGHSKDVLLVDILSAFQWFNPAMWLLKKDLRAIHEFEADDAVLRGGANIKEYQYSLIRKAVSASGYSITNSFNHSILKNRITMMSKSNASRMRGLRVLYILPLVCGALALNAKTVTDYKVSENSEVAADDGSTIRVELKKDSNGDYRCLVMNGSVTFDDMFDAISTLINGDKSMTVEILAPSDCPCGVVEDIKQGLRGISALKVQYAIPDLEPVTRHLPPSKEAAEKAGATLRDSWEVIQSQPKENVHYVRINENDKVLFDTTPINMEELNGRVSDVVRHNHKYVICYQVNRGTSYGAYVTAEKEMRDAVLLVRNEYAKSEYGKAFDDLNDEEQKSIIMEIPLNISELEAKKNSK